MLKLFKTGSYDCSKVNKLLLCHFSSSAREKKTFERTKDHLNLCMLGSSSHGKTCLTSSITYLLSKVNSTRFKSVQDIDNSSEEIKKQMSINPSKLDYETSKRRCFLTDCPGHRDYLKNAIIGSFKSDAGILVVDASKGPCEQTRQHLYIAKHAGLDHLIIFISKADIADDDSRELAELATREMLTDLKFDEDKITCIHGSALLALKEDDNSDIGAKSIHKLINTIDNLPYFERDLKAKPIFNISKVVSPTGRPNGVTGILQSGVLKKGQDVEIIGMDRALKTRVVQIESFDQVMQEAQAGDSVELLLQGVKRDDLLRGMTICEPGAKMASDHFEATLELVQRADGKKVPLITSAFEHIFMHTADTHSQVLLMDKEYVLPEETAKVELKLFKGLSLEEEDSFIIKDNEMVIGIGRVKKLLPNLNGEEKMKLSKGKSKAERARYAEILSKLEQELN